MTNILHFPHDKRVHIDAFLPSLQQQPGFESGSRPYVTLTYATSLDSQIALRAGTPTVLSGPESKAMTHYLRSKHDAIMVGSGTALADNPTLNSRLDEAVALDTLERQPRPVILDRRGRYTARSHLKVVAAAHEGRGRKPWIVTPHESHPSPWIDFELVDPGSDGGFPSVLATLKKGGINSVMVEGGGTLINIILQHHADLVDAVIVTIAPRYLGVGGVTVSPERTAPDAPAVRFKDVAWIPLGNDVVMCGRIDR